MKTKFMLVLAFTVILVINRAALYSQANNQLSNLFPTTAVNQHLLPFPDAARDLGNPLSQWRNLYFSNGIFIRGNLAMHATGSRNFFVGSSAGNILVTGADNTGSGVNALKNLTTGYNNTGMGSNALYSVTTGHNNLAVGTSALYFDTSGYFNTATGPYAMYENRSGYYNTASGTSALRSNTSGHNNSAFGTFALHSSASGYNNTAIGDYTMYANNTGCFNTAVGSTAMQNNSTGYNNTANGFQSLNKNTGGFNNTASGNNSLLNNTTGNYNTAVGSDALNRNLSGGSNTAIGVLALYANQTGSRNTASGSQSLWGNFTGTNNTASGYNALYGNNASFNTGSGSNALYNNVSGNANSAFGYNSMLNITSGSNNTAVGQMTLLNNITGSNNTVLGTYADVLKDQFTNATAIGYGAIVDKGNKIRFGNAAVNVVEGPVAYTISDGRFKTDITDGVIGLSFINKLRPILYSLQARKLDEFMMKNLSSENRENLLKSLDYSEAEKTRRSGFIAQEVELAAKESGYMFDGVTIPKNGDEHYSLAYAEFVVPLVKAVQELFKQNEALQKQVNELRSLSTTGSINAASQKLSDVSIDQNIPNPFHTTTKINYTLPPQFTIAQLLISDKNGNVLKQLNISGSGKGFIDVDAAILSSGAYTYSLIINGKLSASKQMLLVK